MESNLKPVQQLGILMAMQKMVKAKTDEVRRQVEADMNARFAEDGIDRQRLVLDGEEVGKVSLKVKEESMRSSTAKRSSTGCSTTASSCRPTRSRGAAKRRSGRF